MKTLLKILFALFICLLPLVSASASSLQQIIPGGKLVLGGTYNLANGETLDGGLLILGGIVELQAGSTVEGNVAMLGGNLDANGQINGNIIALGGLVRLGPQAVIAGDVNVLGGDLQGEELAVIEGQASSDANLSLPLVFPGGARIPLPNLEFHFNPLVDILWLLVRTLVWAALAALAVLFASGPIRRVAETIVTQPIISGGLGLLTVVIGLLFLGLLAVTILCIPLALLGLAALIVAWAFGIIAIGTETGLRLSKAARGDWALPLSAALGTFLVTFLLNILGEIACVGWIPQFLVGSVGLGAVLLTRFGSRPYPS